MTTLREAAQQALEALVSQFDGRADGIDILSAALAEQPQPLTELPPLPEPAGKLYSYNYTADQMRAYGRAVEAALAEQKCPCGDRPADQCPGEWEPGCDLGANEKYAKVAEQPQPLTIERLRDALVASRIIDPGAVEDPDDYDDGVTLHRIEALFRRIA